MKSKQRILIADLKIPYELLYVHSLVDGKFSETGNDNLFAVISTINLLMLPMPLSSFTMSSLDDKIQIFSGKQDRKNEPIENLLIGNIVSGEVKIITL